MARAWARLLSEFDGGSAKPARPGSGTVVAEPAGIDAPLAHSRLLHTDQTQPALLPTVWQLKNFRLAVRHDLHRRVIVALLLPLVLAAG